jgi:hypothetical protein
MPTTASNRSGKAWIVVLGLVLIGAGAVGAWFLLTAYRRTKEVREQWQTTTTTIDRSEMEEVKDGLNAAPRFEVVIKYSYTVNLESIESYRVTRADGNMNGRPKLTRSLSDKSAAEALLAKYPLGQQTVCYVNPKDPKQAVLDSGNMGSIYSIWFPLLFVAGGLGMIINTVLPHHTDKVNLRVKGS